VKGLIQLKQKDIKQLKEDLHLKQNGICPLLGVEVPLDDMVLDHKHKRKADPAGPNGDGLVRGSIGRFANAIEGKISNNWKRMGLDKHTDLPTFLRNLADYLENPPCDQIYIHPSEAIKPKKLGIRAFNKINKAYQLEYPRRKALVYPKSKKPTKLIRELSIRYQIDI
jgi:hypothetical protein